jgi:predicted NBD/HSP70 family sugar kinase
VNDLAEQVSGFGAAAIFQLLRDGRPRTRAELVSETGFARATVASRIDALVASGLVVPVEDASSTGGRRSGRIARNPQARVVAAADFGANHATVAITDLAGEVLAESTTRREIALGPTSTLDWLINAITELREQARRPVADLIAVGIGLPGPVEHPTGKPFNPPIMPGWDGYDVPAHVQSALPVPVLVDNDVNIMALGERAKGGWPNTDNLLFVKVATGIGSGIISGGLLQRGANGSAGDIGHIPIPRAQGVKCRCGNVGCLEAIAAAPAIASTLSGASTADDVITMVSAGDHAAVQAVHQAGRDIGEVINMMVSVVNPSLIVIGGSLSNTNGYLVAGIREVVYSRPFSLATQDLTITTTRVGTEAGVVGAAAMAIEHVLSPSHFDKKLRSIADKIAAR